VEKSFSRISIALYCVTPPTPLGPKPRILGEQIAPHLLLLPEESLTDTLRKSHKAPLKNILLKMGKNLSSWQIRHQSKIIREY
jgi:hypothetical protein